MTHTNDYLSANKHSFAVGDRVTIKPQYSTWKISGEWVIEKFLVKNFQLKRPPYPDYVGGWPNARLRAKPFMLELVGTATTQSESNTTNVPVPGPAKFAAVDSLEWDSGDSNGDPQFHSMPQPSLSTVGPTLYPLGSLVHRAVPGNAHEPQLCVTLQTVYTTTSYVMVARVGGTSHEFSIAHASELTLVNVTQIDEMPGFIIIRHNPTPPTPTSQSAS